MPIRNGNVRTKAWAQRWLRLGVIGCLVLLWRPTRGGADTVTLKSGEVLEGQILSESDTQLVIEASFYHGTILSKREVARSDIQSVVRETPELKQEKADYEGLSNLTLNPNQELTKTQYDAGIAMFETFLTAHSNSTDAAEVSRRLADWQAEASNVASGKVKFAGAWMTPAEKNVKAARAAVDSLKEQLAELQRERAARSNRLATTEKQLADAQSRLGSITGGSGSAPKQPERHDLAGRVTAGVVGVSQGENMGEPVSNPERAQVENEVSTYQQQATQQQGALAMLDAKITDIQSQLPAREQSYQTAVAESTGASSATNAAAAAASKPARSTDTNGPAKTAHVPAPASEPALPWYSRAWKWIHG
ncbi:MAG TPA: hypothetical protein VMP11_05350 [Verrucomicrobiae bacterium]|nr:hypothetical protein [Verrucomicrobiae bacterium]